MHLFKIHRTLPRLKQIILRQMSQLQVVAHQDEYTDTPEYPPILDLSLQARKWRQRQEIYAKIQKLNTIEEKQIALNMPRYYGWQCIMFKEDFDPYNALPLIKCYTRTHFVPMDKLPDFYNNTEATASEIVPQIKSQIEDAIAIELEGLEREYGSTTDNQSESQKANATTKCIIRQINRIITNKLVDSTPHILAAQVDYKPRHEAFWFVGSTSVPTTVIKWRKQYKWLKNRLYEPIDRPVQYIGSPILTVRNSLPLKPILPYSEAENTEYKVEKIFKQAFNLGYNDMQFRHGTNIPGFWPGDYDEFGLLSFHDCGHIKYRSKHYGEEDNLEAIHCQGIKASFGWLLAQANYQGFTTYNDITYPLATQTVLTDGRLISFYAYQLNTITLHNELMDTNPKHNICFGSNPLPLYESLENGKVKGLNDDVLKQLVQFYLNTPQERDHDMKPYLGKEESVVADIEDDNKRCWLEQRYKHLVSNRPRHLLEPEVYDWEKIYKIQFNTRFFERRVRPFALGINPFKRRLDEHLPPYIPKALRPYPRHKKKFESTYYPEV